MAQTVARLQPQVEKLDQPFELRPEEGLVVGGENDGLGKPGAEFDENKLGVNG